jgi:hypothetical protein
LSDVSATPPVALSGETVALALATSQCAAVTDANGLATCQLTPSAPGMTPLTAAFAGTNALAGSAASVGFKVVGRSCTPFDCDDADSCTADSCADGQCQHVAPGGFDGARCYLDAAKATLKAASAADVKKRIKTQLIAKLTKIEKLVQTARGGGKKSKRARKKADHLLGAFAKKVGKLGGKRLASPIANDVVRFVDAAKAALDAA